MGEFILFLAIFIGIMAVCALIFGGWFLVMLVRGVASLLGLRPSLNEPGAIGPRRPSGAYRIGPVPSDDRELPGGDGVHPCPYELCHAPNAANARFCRRCGRELVPVEPVQTRRRAAVW